MGGRWSNCRMTYFLSLSSRCNMLVAFQINNKTLTTGSLIIRSGVRVRLCTKMCLSVILRQGPSLLFLLISSSSLKIIYTVNLLPFFPLRPQQQQQQQQQQQRET